MEERWVLVRVLLEVDSLPGVNLLGLGYCWG